MRTAFKLLPVVAGIFAAAFAAPSHAVGGPSGLKVGYAVQGTLGETIVNPSGLAPLTAVIFSKSHKESVVNVSASIRYC